MEKMEKLKAQDLRIGNYLDYEGEQVEVCKIEENFYSVYHSVGVLESVYHKFQPIPLTEEWLLKLGFILIGESYFVDILRCIYLKKPFRESQHYLVKSNSGEKLSSIHFVHQLQNLFYALTGEELECK